MIKAKAHMQPLNGLFHCFNIMSQITCLNVLWKFAPSGLSFPVDPGFNFSVEVIFSFSASFSLWTDMMLVKFRSQHRNTKVYMSVGL